MSRLRKIMRVAVPVSMTSLLLLLLLRARRHSPAPSVAVPSTVASSSADAGSGSDVTPPVQAFVGVVLAERAVDVIARVDGILSAVPVKVGQRVAANAVLGRIDAFLTDQELAMGEASARAAAAELARVKREGAEAQRQTVYKRGLHDAGVGSAEEVEQARFQAETARLRVAESTAKVQERHARIVELRRNLASAVVRAPFQGTVAARYVDPGASVQVQAKLFRIVGDGKSIVRFAVPQTDAGSVLPGMIVHATGNASNGKIRARVDSISPEVDPAANMLFVEAEVIESSGSPWHSGELVRVARPTPAAASSERAPERGARSLPCTPRAHGSGIETKRRRDVEWPLVHRDRWYAKAPAFLKPPFV
jgi:RND family efflux transporter MFP subunit